MTRDKVIELLKQYFQVYELVGRKTYKKYGEDSWQFLQTEALHTLLVLRVLVGRKATINDWYWGGKYQQRGLRTNLQQLFRFYFLKRRLYLSGHVLGCAFDVIFEGISANEVRRLIIANQHKFPYKIRLERKKNGKFITWVHIDTKYLKRNPKVYLFNV
ncbi:hypothetical protein CXF68_09290 [Tenacibaculum sp. Bg11-29]|uniref:hypothetical protein n=1 Tax=Tenacibaculum sp. Bg11-29 TaxID=2058306 RepID=UPI000C330705|nr:hypothetical protein [Tenacibaculum sp. Bg11-29]PKH50868.1 hypothetical protein CXF68_09290 [Tenacibaculum sp. Bg11-29]